MKHGSLMKSRYALVLFLLNASVFATTPQSPQAFLQQTHVNGNLRSYYFNRNYGNPQMPDQHAYSLGGRLNVISPDIHGFSGEATYFAADSLGLNGTDALHEDRTLPARSVNVLGQAFLQYHRPYKLLLRVGEQTLSSPWLNSVDTRMIPASYQAVFASYMPTKTLTLTAFRLFEYKSRTSNQFNKTNLYTPGNDGGTPIPALSNVRDIGAFASGIRYRYNEKFQARGWYYKMYNFANLVYADAELVCRNNSHYTPVLAIQAANEWGDGKNYLNSVGLGKTKAVVYGALIGLGISNGRILFSYNYIPIVSGAYKNGDVVSPYTTGYINDPLYSSSMSEGLIEQAAGHSFKIGGHYLFFQKQLRVALSFAEYHIAAPLPNTDETDCDITYTFNSHALRGLSLRNRLGFLNGRPELGRFAYERFMIQYEFG